MTNAIGAEDGGAKACPYGVGGPDGTCLRQGCMAWGAIKTRHHRHHTFGEAPPPSGARLVSSAFGFSPAVYETSRDGCLRLGQAG